MKNIRFWTEIVVVILAVGLGFLIGRASLRSQLPKAIEQLTVLPGETTSSRQPVPPGTVVPEKGQAVSDASIAVPTSQIPAGPNTTSQKRTFEIAIRDGAFVPSTIILREGDVGHITLGPTDQSYYFTQPDYGLSIMTKGSGGIIEAQFTTIGKFSFYCSSCNSGTGPAGYIIVVPK